MSCFDFRNIGLQGLDQNHPKVTLTFFFCLLLVLASICSFFCLLFEMLAAKWAVASHNNLSVKGKVLSM